MPLTRVSVIRGKSAAYRAAILDGLYRAMRATFNAPDDDRFMVVTEHDRTDFSYGASYLDIARTDDLVLIQLTVSDTRTVTQKQALFAAIRDELVADPGIWPEDIFINLVEVKPENWSFGHGLAQYATAAPSATEA
jgi:phenylpyruvate tautomerase PptA (4-oxalocrotonate tautomerase family)